MGRFGLFISILGATLAVAPPTSAGEPGVILHVDDDARAGGDGLAWKTAFADLQDALDIAAEPKSGVAEIRVAQGVYRPSKLADPNDPRSASFGMVNGVMIAGGYAGAGNKESR